MSLINPKNLITLAGMYKLNKVNKLIIYIALIIPHNKAREDAINKFTAKVLAVNAFELVSILFVS